MFIVEYMIIITDPSGDKHYRGPFITRKEAERYINTCFNDTFDVEIASMTLPSNY